MGLLDRMTVAVDANTTGLDRGLNHAERRVGSFGKQMGFLGNAVSTGIGFLGAQAWMAVTSGTIAATKAGINYNATLESNRIAFTTMFNGNAKMANDFIAKIEKFAATTPFEFPELTDSAKKLMAFGFTAKDVLGPDGASGMMKAIGDSAAAMGGSPELIQRIVYALGQMKAKSKVSAEEMLQLTEANIPAWQILADAMGKSTQEVMELSRKGLIPADQAIQALIGGMEERFPNAMEAQSKSFNGLMSTLRDNFGMILGKVFEPLFKKISGANGLMQKAVDITTKITDALKEGKSLGSVFADIFDLPEMPKGDLGFLNILPSKEELKKVGTAFGANLGAGVFEGLMLIIEKTQGLMEGMYATLGLDIDMDSYFEPFKEMAGLIGVVVGGFQQIGQAVGSVDWSGALGTLIDIWQSVYDFIGPIIAMIVGYIRTEFQWVIQWFVTNMPLIKATVERVLQAILNIWNAVWPVLKAVIMVVWPPIKTIITSVIRTIFAIIKAVMQLITGDWRGAWETIKTAAVNIMKATLKAITQVLSGLWNLIKGPVERAWKWLGQQVSRWVQKGRDLMQGLINGIKAMKDRVISAIIGLFGKAGRKVADMLGLGSPSKVYEQYGRWMMEGLAQGIEKATPKVNKSLSKVGMVPAFGFSVAQPVPVVSGVTYGPTTINLSASISSEMDIIETAKKLDRLLQAQRRAAGER